MLSFMRTKFNQWVVGGIIGFIAFVFVFYGVFNPKSTRGLHEGTVAGEVNGDPIGLAEFNRQLNQRLEFFRQMGGGKITEAQLKAFRVREGVFEELVNRKLMAQAAVSAGLTASDEEVRQKIKEIPAFQKDGRFDTTTYRQVLEANNHTPGSFEKMVREDLSLQSWQRYFKDRVRVSDEEMRREYLVMRDKRDIRYVLLTADSAKRAVQVSDAEVRKFLTDTAKLNLARTQYEQRKASPEMKNLSFDIAKEKIAREILAGEKTEELKKINDRLADQALGVLTASKSSDAKVNALLKPYGVTVKSTGLIARTSPYIPGIGEAKDLMADAFASKSPIDPSQGGKPKKYVSGAWWVVAVVAAAERPDLAKLETEREQIVQQLTARKERELYEAWMKRLREGAKIVKNTAVVSEDGEGGG